MRLSRLSRRAFLRLTPVAVAALVTRHDPERPPTAPVAQEGLGAATVPEPPAAPPPFDDAPTRLDKIRNFDRPYPDDVVLRGPVLELLETTAARLTRARDFIGFGNFNLIGFDHLLRIAQNYPAVGGEFTRAEIDFLDEIFHTDATLYGFRGAKVMTELKSVIPKRDVRKIAGTGHYLLRGEAMRKYDRIRRDLGESVILTSGVRGVVKQFELFLDKAVRTRGNLSQASRSLAPPGYSYHAVGDFDIGKVGYGLENFTEAFCETEEYRRLIDLGYVAIRYTPTNPFGVRHEPWHIKVA